MEPRSVLSRPTLVLNQAWRAIHTVSVRHALRLLVNDAAKAVVPESYEVHGWESWFELSVSDGEPCVRTVRLRIRAPEVIVLVGYTGAPRTSAAFTRRNLFRRDANTCQYCGTRPHLAELSIDHVVPRSLGGRSSWENCVLSCKQCNHKKRNRTPAQAGMQLSRRPEKPRWSPLVEAPCETTRSRWARFLNGHHQDAGHAANGNGGANGHALGHGHADGHERAHHGDVERRARA